MHLTVSYQFGMDKLPEYLVLYRFVFQWYRPPLICVCVRVHVHVPIYVHGFTVNVLIKAP